MSIKSQYETLFAYQWHTTQRLLECAARLSTADYHENPGYGHGSIHDLHLHLLNTLWAWRTGFETGQQPPGRTAEAYPDLASLQAGFAQEKTEWDALLQGMSEEQIEGVRNLTGLDGQTYPMVVWRILQHLILHGMQHHTEIAQLLTQKGESPGDIDFLFYPG